MHLHPKCMYFFQIIILLLSVSYSTSNPSSLSDHLKHLTGKILAINPKTPHVVSPTALSLPHASANAASSPSGHSVAKTLASAISATSAKQHEMAQAVKSGRKVTKKRGMLSTFLSFPKGLRAALPLFGIRPLVQSATSRPGPLIPSETMFHPSFLSPQASAATGPAGVPLAQFLESQTAPTTHYAHRPHAFLTPPFLGHVPTAAGSSSHSGDSSESLGISESLISALHHQDQEHRHQHHQGPVRQQIQFIPLHPHQQQQLHPNPHYQFNQQQQVQQPNPQQDQQPGQGEEAEKVMYVYVDEEGKTVATKVADMDMGPEVALPDGYNIKAVGAPLPVSPQDQRQAQQQQQVQQQQQQQQQATHQLAHEIREVETAAAPQRPVLAGFASMEEMTAAADSATPTPPAPVSAYLQSHSSPQMNAGSVEGHDDLGTEGPVGIGIPVSMNDPRAGRIIFPGPDHKAKTILTEESVIPDPIVDPEIPHSDPSQDMVFMLGDYNQYLKSQSASESDGQDAASAADEFLHSLTSAPASDVESDARHSARGRPGQHTVSLRPPIRKQRILSTHGGWIPISRSPDHDRHVTVAILTRKQNGEKKEQVEEKHQENQNPDHRPSEGEEKREAETAAAGDSDVDKSESEPKVHFDDETTSNLNDQPTRVTFSTSSSVSSSKEPERVKSASEDQPAADSSNESESNKQQQAVQKRSKYNVAAVFDHQFNPIFTSKSKSLDEIKDHELYSASKGSYGLRIPRSSDFERDSDGSERIESSLVPSSSLHASSSSSAAFSLRSGLMARQLEESLKRPAGHFLVPVPGHDGGVKAYIVLSS